jgi:DnaK suppressor protein
MEPLTNLGSLTMTQTQTIHFRAAIENHRRELVSEIHSQTRQIVIAESEHDPIDQVQSIQVREESAIRLGRRSHILAEVDRSLEAISEGSYGLCVDCEEPIGLKRLESIPWAPHCLRCQELLERWEPEGRQAA